MVQQSSDFFPTIIVIFIYNENLNNSYFIIFYFDNNNRLAPAALFDWSVDIPEISFHVAILKLRLSQEQR